MPQRRLVYGRRLESPLKFREFLLELFHVTLHVPAEFIDRSRLLRRLESDPTGVNSRSHACRRLPGPLTKVPDIVGEDTGFLGQFTRLLGSASSQFLDRRHHDTPDPRGADRRRWISISSMDLVEQRITRSERQLGQPKLRLNDSPGLSGSVGQLRVNRIFPDAGRRNAPRRQVESADPHIVRGVNHERQGRLDRHLDISTRTDDAHYR